MKIDNNVIISGCALVHSDTEITPDEDLFNKYVKKKIARLATRTSKLGLSVCEMAMIDADIADINDYYPSERRSAFICSPNSTTELDEMFPSFDYVKNSEISEKELNNYYAQGAKKIYPLWLIRGLSNLALGVICIKHEIKGTSCNWSDYHTDSRFPLLEGIYSILEHKCDFALVGAFDSLTSWYHTEEFRACEEFKGTQPAEAGIFLVLEKKEIWSERTGEEQGWTLSIDDINAMDSDLTKMISKHGNCGAAAFMAYNFWDKIKKRKRNI